MAVSGCPHCPRGGRQHRWRRYRESLVGPARSKNQGMYGTSKRENREIPPSPVRLITGRAAQGTLAICGGTPEMHESGKSDRLVVPANPPNKAAAAEVGEGRGRAEGNTASKTRPGHSAGTDASSALDRVREVARREREGEAPISARQHALLPRRAPCCQAPRQEPSAVVPHAGICAGGRPQGRSLPRHTTHESRQACESVPI